MKSSELLAALENILDERKRSSPKDSYAALLFSRGKPGISAKIEEESAELVEAYRAAKSAENATEHRKHIIHETADLWFHSMILLSHQDIRLDDVLAELSGRFGKSGLTPRSKDMGIKDKGLQSN